MTCLEQRIREIADRWRAEAAVMERDLYTDEVAIRAIVDELDEALGRPPAERIELAPAEWAQ